jgi:ABC-type lipoprotein release transport system permease subunit
MFSIIIITIGAILGYFLARLFLLIIEVLADFINLLF